MTLLRYKIIGFFPENMILLHERNPKTLRRVLQCILCWSTWTSGSYLCKNI